MPISIDYQTETGVFYLTATGDIGLKEIMNAIRTCYGDPLFTEPFKVLWDARKGNANLSPDDMYQVTEFVSFNRPAIAGRTALLTSSDLEFGLTRMYTLLLESRHVDTRSFRDYDEAVAWLNDL